VKSRLFATAAAVLTATTALVALLCLMGQGNPPAPYLALAAPMAAPTVTAVDPASAPNDLDTPIVITGTGFTAGLTVTLGSTRLPDATWVSATMLTATVPWGLDPGVYTLTVTNPDGQSGSLPNAFTVTQGLGVWTTGGPYGGVIGQIIINPITPTTLYAASESIGLFRSLDSGNNWKLVLADIGYGHTTAVDTLSPQTMYVARWRRGFARSEDGGDTWTALAPPGLSNALINAAFTPPTISGTVYIATNDNGLWKSQDRGQTWVDWTNGLTDTLVTAMAFHPTDVLTMYVGTEQGNVFRSANGGLSWEFVGQPDATISQLAVNPFGAHELWAVGNMYRGFLWKYDSGTWVDILAGTGITRGVTIAFDQNISGTIWIGAQGGVYTSTDDGQTWTPPGTWTDDRIGALAIHPFNSQHVYAGYGGNGVYQTMDGGTTWQPINAGLAALVPQDLAPVPAEPNALYAATSIGLLKTANGGNAWAMLPATQDWGTWDMVIDPFTHTRIYAGEYAKLDIGENGGTVWHQAPVTAPAQYETCCGVTIRALLANPALPGHLVMGVGFTDPHVPNHWWIAGGIYTSTDYGETWNWVNLGYEITGVVALAYDPANPLVLYAGMNSGIGEGIAIPVVKSSDGGNTWQVSSTGLEGTCGIKSIAVEPVSPHRVFASSACGNYLRVSTNGGATWNQANSPAPSGGVIQHLVFAPGESMLYAGTTHGLYRTGNGAQSWEPVPGALGSATVHALAVVTTTGRMIVYGSTAGGIVTTTAGLMRGLATSGETLLNPGVYRYTTRVGGLQASEISGPTTGLVQRAYTFTATVSPSDAALPITYEWQATELSPVTHIGGLSDTVVFTWTTPGVKAITVMAQNSLGAPVVDIHIIMMEQYHLYLPVILRNG